MLSNNERNLVDSFERDSIYEFNLSFQELSFRQLSLSLNHNMQLNTISRCDISHIKYVGIKTLGFVMIRHKIKNSFGFQPYKWQMVVILNILNRFDIAVHTDASLQKSLPF